MFKNISTAEYDKLKKAIPLITLYVAGADGDIDSEELDWSKKLTNIRGFASDEYLNEYYEDVNLDFSEQLNLLLNDKSLKRVVVEERLAELNPIIAKLKKRTAAHLYKSYMSFAKQIAKASGGFFGIQSINDKENIAIKLKMITPVDTAYFEEE